MYCLHRGIFFRQRGDIKNKEDKRMKELLQFMENSSKVTDIT